MLAREAWLVRTAERFGVLPSAVLREDSRLLGLLARVDAARGSATPVADDDGFDEWGG